MVHNFSFPPQLNPNFAAPANLSGRLLQLSVLRCCWLAGLLAISGCQKKLDPMGGGPGGMPPAAVTLAPVEQRELVEFDEFTGRVDATETVEVRARVSGYLDSVKFSAGQLVNKGEILFIIDSRTRKAILDRAEAELQRAESQLEISGREAKRAEQLSAAKTISSEEADTRLWRWKEAQAAHLAARAARESARLDLEFCEVRAPISGKVSRALVTPGNNISGVDGFTTLLTTIVAIDPVHVYADVDEASLLKLSGLFAAKQTAGSDGRIPIELSISDGAGYARKGFLESIDNRIDPTTGSILLRAEFPNPDGQLVPGLFARVRVPGSVRAPTLLISELAIGTDQNQRFVYTVSPSNTVEYRPVKLGPTVDGKRVVRSGLKAGENIVVNGLIRIRPGMPVQPTVEASAAAR